MTLKPNIFRKLYRIIWMRIYTNDTVFLFELNKLIQQDSAAHIKKASQENITDALYFQSKQQVQKFKYFLQKGDVGYFAYLNGHCVHRSWVVQNPEIVSIHKFYTMPLKNHEIFVQFCETANEARRKNIFAHVLSTIAHDFKNKRILISVDAENVPSLKSISKVGFKKINRVKIKIWFGFKKITSVQLIDV